MRPTVFMIFKWLPQACAAAVLLWPASYASAQPPVTTPARCIDVKLVNLVEGQGSIKLAVWGSAEAYFKAPLVLRQIKAQGAVMRVPVCGLDAKEIAITVYQDLNDNGKMDRNSLGIPSEPYGASGTPPMFSAPTWETTKLVWVADQTIEIRL